MARRLITGFGAEYKKQVRRFYTAPVGMTVRAAMLSRRENYVELDPQGVVDAWLGRQRVAQFMAGNMHRLQHDTTGRERSTGNNQGCWTQPAPR